MHANKKLCINMGYYIHKILNAVYFVDRRHTHPNNSVQNTIQYKLKCNEHLPILWNTLPFVP